MRSDHHGEVVSLEERVYVVWAEIHHVVLLLWVADVVVLEAALVFSFVGVAPKKI